MSDPFAPPPSEPYRQPPLQPPPGQIQPGPGALYPSGPPPAGTLPPGAGAPGYPVRTGPYSPIVGRPLVADETTWAMLVHLSVFALSIIGPIIVMSTKGNQSPYVRRHAVEALNMHLTMLIIDIVCIFLFWLILPLLVIFGLSIAAAVYGIMAAMAANRGEDYRYPMIWRMVK